MLTEFGISGRYVRTPYGLFTVDDFDTEELCEVKQQICDELKSPEKNYLEHVRLSDTLIEINGLINRKEMGKIGDAGKGVELLQGHTGKGSE